MAMGNQLHKYKRHEVQRRLLAIKTFADEFAKQHQYAAALTIYEALVTQVIAHYNTYPDESIAFSVILQSCIDGLDTCFAGEEDHQHIRLRVLQALFVIYRFFTDQSMDLDEDIPGLLVANTMMQERATIAGWIRDALSANKETQWILWSLLRGSPCRVYSSDMKVFISETRYFHPDVIVTCDPRDRGTVQAGLVAWLSSSSLFPALCLLKRA